MLSRLIEIVESFGRQRILLVGDFILDRYVYGDAERISPEAPVPVLRKQYEEDRVGGAGSVAANLQQLGMNTVCCGLVGLDDAGHRLRALLQSMGANTRGIVSISGRPTTRKTRFIGLAQHRHRQQLIRVDDEITAPMSESDARPCLEVIAGAMKDVAAVCLEDYDKGVLTAGLCRRIIDMARQAGKPVLVDPARIDDYAKYTGATMLTPNRSEFRLATGCPGTAVETIKAHVAGLIEACDLQGVLVTLDRDGCLLALRGREPIHFPTRPRAVYDNTGAGDAVLAMLVAATASGASWEEAAQLTNIAGGLEVEKFGCVPISREEIIADLTLSAADGSAKIRPLPRLVAELRLRRSRGETIVFTNGCFDLLHAGHIHFFRQCRALGQVVVVGLNSDASVRAQNKAPGRPIMPQDERAEVLAALSLVDYVVIFDEPTPAAVIEQVCPDVLVKGEDWAEKGVVGREFVEGRGGRVVLVPLKPGLSTTSVVDRIRAGGR